MKKDLGHEAIYDARQLGTPRMLILGLQHMFAMFGATVLVPILVQGYGLPLSIQTTLLFAGLGTLLFHVCTKFKVPAFLGSSFAYLGGFSTVATMPAYEGLDPETKLAYALGGIVIAGLLYLVLALLFKLLGAKKVMRYFPPIVTGPMIIMIGLNLSGSAINNASTCWWLALGAIAKTYYAKVLGVEPERLFVVSVMPCTAKKAECALPSMMGEGGAPDVDVALTVREMVRMIRASHVSVDTLVEEPLDTPLGFGTGAGVIFGATGGVMEAAVRSAYYLVTGKNPDADFFTDVRGLDGWKEAVADIDGTKVRVAVAHGLGNAARLLDAIRDGRVSYDFVEVMACPGGCVGGGGQPIHDGCELAAERGQVLWGLDANAKIRFSHENPDVQACYREFLGAPLSPLAEELLHTDHHAWTMPNEGTC